jgi:hypothetical protein
MQAELGARIGEAASSRSEEMPLSLSLFFIKGKEIVQKMEREERGDHNVSQQECGRSQADMYTLHSRHDVIAAHTRTSPFLHLGFHKA